MKSLKENFCGFNIMHEKITHALVPNVSWLNFWRCHKSVKTAKLFTCMAYAHIIDYLVIDGLWLLLHDSF